MENVHSLNVNFGTGIRMLIIAVSVATMVFLVVRLMESINRRRGGRNE